MPSVRVTWQLPEERTEFDDAQFGADWHAVVNETLAWIRSELKYQNHKRPMAEALETVRTKLCEFVDDRNLEL